MTTTTKKGIAITVIIFAIFIFGYTLVHAIFYSPTDEISINDSAIPLPVREIDSDIFEQGIRELPAKEFPIRIEIPNINVDAKVQQVGINSSGNMAAPSNFSDVGWYKYGVLPGQPGNAVLDGHVDNGLSLPGIFKNLKDVNIGDEIFITGEKGTKTRFVVSAINVYKFDEAPAEEIFSEDGNVPRLKLITCDGIWLRGEKTYDQRLVITALLDD